MNFERNQQQDSENFNIPERGVFAQENFSKQPQENQIVEPFVAPENFENPVENRAENLENSLKETQDREIMNWQAQDFVIGEKTMVWYAVFAVIVAALVGVSIWGRNYTFTALIVVSAAAILATRRMNHSKMISYSLSARGFYIGNNFYAYDDFKSFGILRDSAVYSIVFIPKKRFAPSTSIYFSKSDGEKITDIIGQRLPMEQVKSDIIDRIVRKIKL